MIRVKGGTAFDTAEALAGLAGDDFSFSYDATTAIITIQSDDVKDVSARYRSWKLDNGDQMVFESDGTYYDYWGDAIPLPENQKF